MLVRVYAYLFQYTKAETGESKYLLFILSIQGVFVVNWTQVSYF